VFSIGSLLLLSLLFVLSDLSNFAKGKYQDRNWSVFEVWAIASIIPDYFNLYKTRLIMDWMAKRAVKVRTVLPILVVDFAVGFAIFYTMLVVLEQLLLGKYLGFRRLDDLFSLFWWKTSAENVMSFSAPAAALFYASMVPSAWLYIYGAGVLATTAILRIEPLLHWFVWALDVDKAPLRSVGVVAGILVFSITVVFTAISGVAKILVS
jgi:hypothetical protein